MRRKENDEYDDGETAPGHISMAQAVSQRKFSN